MVNTMADLREEVASRLRNSLHGREIDMMETSYPGIPHMLGITPIDKVHDPHNEEMTLLDTQHPFWENYEEDVRTKNKATEKIETAIRSLKEDDIFRMTYPYGEEADIIYVEVDKLQSDGDNIQTSCKECGEPVTTNPSLDQNRATYHLTFSIRCEECGYTATFGRSLQHIR